MSDVPTLQILKLKRRLRLVNPGNGVTFTLLFKEVLGVMAIRFRPDDPKIKTAHTRRYRMISRRNLEQWLSELRIL